ncbi:putative nuclease HARBI1 [Anastrepha ludens]|uniref:putative nuclease HARBI1 n=1 Tax=Anastrepha ludens TaxID=28586 RepID=UPI0023AE70D2|nr:putative nuclease HARBI1 [Anastrepha ludens]
MKITYINAKNPGATHDSISFNMSPLKAHLEEQHLNGRRNTWLLGDARYALKPYLMTAFKNSEEGSPQRAYNKQHAKARSIIERTIRVLKMFVAGKSSPLFSKKSNTNYLCVCTFAQHLSALQCSTSG